MSVHRLVDEFLGGQFWGFTTGPAAKSDLMWFKCHHRRVRYRRDQQSCAHRRGSPPDVRGRGEPVPKCRGCRRPRSAPGPASNTLRLDPAASSVCRSIAPAQFLPRGPTKRPLLGRHAAWSVSFSLISEQRNGAKRILFSRYSATTGCTKPEVKYGRCVSQIKSNSAQTESRFFMPCAANRRRCHCGGMDGHKLVVPCVVPVIRQRRRSPSHPFQPPFRSSLLVRDVRFPHGCWCPRDKALGAACRAHGDGLGGGRSLGAGHRMVPEHVKRQGRQLGRPSGQRPVDRRRGPACLVG